MRNIYVLAIAIVFASCSQKGRYTQNSPEIETYKKSIAAYENRDWDNMATLYADSAKIMSNTTKKNALTVAQNIALNKKDSELFSKWKFDKDESEYEMVVTDKGETWVNFWGVWYGTLKINNEVYEIPVSLTAKFVDGKIVQEYGYWDNSKLLMDIQKTSQNMALTNVAPNQKSQ